MGNHDPFVVENGGAIVIPRGYFPGMGNRSGKGDLHTLTFGVPHEECARELRKLARQTGVQVRGFRQMSIAEIARSTGLTKDEVRRAKERETGEVFTFLGASQAKIRSFSQLAYQRGFSVRRGGRFWHFASGCDKGLACSVLTDLFQLSWGQQVHTIALGDSPNDLLMLQLADSPILMPLLDGSFDKEITARIPSIARASKTASQGWGAAVFRALRVSKKPAHRAEHKSSLQARTEGAGRAKTRTESAHRGRSRTKVNSRKTSRRKQPASLRKNSNAERSRVLSA